MENGQVHKKSKPSEDNILEQQPQLQMQPEIQEVQIQELHVQILKLLCVVGRNK